MGTRQQQRGRRILHLLLQDGETSIDELARQVESSTASVRRDLVKLEAEGLVERRHGGVELAGQSSFSAFRFDAAFAQREKRFADEKRRIGLAAAEMVLDGETIALSPGTTTTHISRSLRHRERLSVVTSAVNIGMELSVYPNLQVTLTGGSVRSTGSFSMVGSTAFHALQRLHFDKVFLGCTGLDPDRGLSVIESDEALILSEMVRCSRQVIAVADSSKLGISSTNIVCEPEKLHTLVTDRDADPEIARRFRERGVQFLMV